jgi:chloride channel protein, CIC family
MNLKSPGTFRVAHPFRWFPEFLEFGKRRMRSQGRVLAASVLVGIVAGFGGILFSIAGQAVVQVALEGAAGYNAPGPAGEVRFPWIPSFNAPFNPWLLLLIPMVGGLLSGLLVYRFAPEAEGHGTDAAIAAYHEHDGYIRPRVPLIKLVASALTIGSGGSGGREGPIAQIGAGFGSLLGGFLGLRPEERRVLLAAGMGAGVAAIFRAPLAGTLFAAEILYCSPEFEPEVILPTGLASVVSYCTFGVLAFRLGGTTAPWRPLFDAPGSLVFTSAWELLPYSVLAIWVAVLAMVYVRTFYAIQHAFESVRIPKALRPAVGAGLSGLVALAIFFAAGQQRAALAVLSFGYGVLQEGLHDAAPLSAILLLAIAAGKIVTTGLTIGSGGSGGVFGPSMVIGGCAGGSLGVFVHNLWPAAVPHPGTYVILGMAGFFAAAAKTPFSTLIIVSEMTGDYRLLLPALWVCTLAFLLSDEQPLYRSQIVSRSLSPAHRGEFVREVLAGMHVRQFLKDAADVPTLRANDSLAAVASRFDKGAYSVLPVIGPDNSLLGVVVLDELHVAVKAESAGSWLLAADLMRSDIRPLHPDDRLDLSMQLFAETDLLALPVVDGSPQNRVIGLVRRADLSKAYLSKLQGTLESSVDHGDGRVSRPRGNP